MEENYNNREMVQRITNELSNISYYSGYTNRFGISFTFLYLLSIIRDNQFKQDGLVELEYSSNLKKEIVRFVEDYRVDDLLHSHFEDVIVMMPENLVKSVFSLVMKVEFWFLKENFHFLFDDILKWTTSHNRLYVGDARQPIELSRFILKLANLPTFGKVYNPFAGFASLGTLLNENQYYDGQEINIDYWALGKLRLNAYNKNNYHFVNDDSLRYWNIDGNYDLVFAYPPFRISRYQYLNDMRINSLNWYIIEKGLESLSDNGKLICVFPISFLYAGSKNDKNLRKFLVENDLIETIVLLPSKVILQSSILFCLVVLSKRNTNNQSIRMIDATDFTIRSRHSKNEIFDDVKLLEVINNYDNSAVVKFVSKSRVINEDYDLHVNRYFVEDDLKGIPLGSFVVYITGGANRIFDDVKLIRIKDLKNDPFNSVLESSEIVKEPVRAGTYKKIEQDCLLIASRFLSLKPTFFKYSGEPVYISNDIYALDVDQSKVNIRYLIYQLYSEELKKQLQKFSTGSIMPRITRKDILSLKIELPFLKEQDQLYLDIAQKHLASKAEQFGVEVQEQTTNVNDENSFLRHEIAGSLKNVRSSFRLVQKILKEKVADQVVDLYKLKANDILESTLETYLKIIERDLESINRSVNKMGAKIELSDMTFEKVDLLGFIQEYAQSLKVRAGSLYDVQTDLDLDAVFEAKLKTVYIRADKDILRKAFDNLVENAVKHAFHHDTANFNKIRIDLFYDFEDMKVQVDISNNGKTLPAEISYESLVRKGSSYGNNGGEGTGLWYVNEVMKLHGGYFGFTDETGPEGVGGDLATSMELTFPILEE